MKSKIGDVRRDQCTPQEQEALFKYMRYLLRFVARSLKGIVRTRTRRAKARKRCRKKEAVVTASSGGGKQCRRWSLRVNESNVDGAEARGRVKYSTTVVCMDK